jgi:hypothetical protein
VNEDRLRELLRDAPVPDAAEAKQRGWRVVRGAFEQRTPPPPRRPRAGRLAIALAAGLVLCALVLSPAGAGVRDWIGDVFEPGVKDAEPALTGLPGGGRLLVQSAEGPWVVQADGARRLLGAYEDAGWSPRGLFVVAAEGRTLTALEPDGDPRWSISGAAPISAPRWSPSGFRVAYLAGRSLRVIAGDGSGDRLLARRVAPVTPAWRSGAGHVLAYARTPNDLRVVDVDRDRLLREYRTPHGIEAIDWSQSGTLLLTSERSVTLLDRRLSAVDTWRAPPVDRLVAAAPAPDRRAFAVIVQRRRAFAPRRSEVLLVSGREPHRRVRSIFSAPGAFTSLAFSPDGRRLLVTWREADQWLFIPLRGRHKLVAVDAISRQFSPGSERPAFPVVGVAGWCCPG